MPWDALHLIQLDIIGAYQLGASWGAWAQVKDLSSRPYAARELMLIKVRCAAPQRRELSDLADIFHGTVCDVSLTTITLELQGKEDKMHALQGLLEPYGQTLSDIRSNPPSDCDTISCAGWFEKTAQAGSGCISPGSVLCARTQGSLVQPTPPYSCSAQF